MAEKCHMPITSLFSFFFLEKEESSIRRIKIQNQKQHRKNEVTNIDNLNITDPATATRLTIQKRCRGIFDHKTTGAAA